MSTCLFHIFWWFQTPHCFQLRHQILTLHTRGSKSSSGKVRCGFSSNNNLHSSRVNRHSGTPEPKEQPSLIWHKRSTVLRRRVNISFFSRKRSWQVVFLRMVSRCGQAKKTRSPGGEFISARRFKAQKKKQREQSSSVCKGRLLRECLCLNFLTPLLLLYHWQRQGISRERALLFHSLWNQRYEHFNS